MRKNGLREADNADKADVVPLAYQRLRSRQEFPAWLKNGELHDGDERLDFLLDYLRSEAWADDLTVNRQNTHQGGFKSMRRDHRIPELTLLGGMLGLELRAWQNDSHGCIYLYFQPHPRDTDQTPIRLHIEPKGRAADFRRRRTDHTDVDDLEIHVDSPEHDPLGELIGERALAGWVSHPNGQFVLHILWSTGQYTALFREADTLTQVVDEDFDYLAEQQPSVVVVVKR